MATIEQESRPAVARSRNKASKKGFVSVHRSVPRNHLVQIQHSSIPPDSQQLEDHTGERWTLEYYALVDNVDEAFTRTADFLKPYVQHVDQQPEAGEIGRTAQGVYSTHPVVVATAIETSGINIRFRRSMFESLRSDPGAKEQDLKGGYPSDRKLRATLQKSVNRRERVNEIVSEIDSIEQVLEYSERITTRPSARDTAAVPTLVETPHEDTAPTGSEIGARVSEAITPVLYRDTEPESTIQIEGPDADTLQRMEHLILRREATQNLRRIRISYAMSFLQGIPLGAALGFGALMALNQPQDQETLIRFIIAGTVALPILLFGYRLARNWGDASRWRAVLKA